MTTWIRRVFLIACLTGLGSAAGCGSTKSQEGTETNWLSTCMTDADCGPNAQCICAVCTVPCESSASCPAPPAPDSCAQNQAALQSLCGATSPPQGLCFHGCTATQGCAAGYQCVDASCIPERATG